MTPAEAGGRALFLIEHPHTLPWDRLDQPTRDWWITRAQPITNAIQETP